MATYILLLNSALVGDAGGRLRNVLNIVSGDHKLILGTFRDGDTLEHRALPDNLLAHCGTQGTRVSDDFVDHVHEKQDTYRSYGSRRPFHQTQ